MPSQHKLAEKLTILKHRGDGMLTRIYNIKKMLGNPDSKPQFFSDKTLEPIIKNIVRKFPAMDSKSSSSQSSAVGAIKADVIKSLSLYYYTFVDIMDYKDHVTDLLTTMDASQVNFDIAVNYDLTKGYLDVIVTYFCIMILVSRVDDRKAVLGLFNCAYELHNAKSEESFPRLGQMIMDYDPPVKKLAEEFIPHSKCLIQAIQSVAPIFQRRCVKAEEWRSIQMLSLLADSTKIMTVTHIDTMQCEYLSYDVMERWVVVGVVLCHQYLQQGGLVCDLWRQALCGSFVITLCRDEVLTIHSFITSYFDSLKGYNKRVAEVKEFYQQVCQTGPHIHRERRKFLRTALKELATVLTDQPGLLGPKSLYVWMALCLSRDEFLWLLRHSENVPQKKAAATKTEDYVDRQIPELMFHMEELRGLVKKYYQVLQRYYVQYLSTYDADFLNQLIQGLSVCPEDESMILTSFYSTIAELSVKQVEENEIFDFRGLRMDWYRLQAYTSAAKSGLSLMEHKDLAKHMNSIVYHSKMVDSLDDLLTDTSDLSIYCFYTSVFEHQFKQCMEFPAQHRYSISFPMICGHFMNATHDLCPEERQSIGTASIQYAHWFLKEMSEEVNQVITAICEEQCMLADKLLPKHCAPQIAVSVNRKKQKSKIPVETEKPGDESYRKHREEFTRMDKLHMALTELCFAINYCNVINVWEHGFVPREFFTQHLELRFNKALVGMMMYNSETKEVAKPSELLNGIKAIMNVLQSIENYVHIDISRVFNSVLPQQSQPADSFTGAATITAIYTKWYLEVLLRRVSMGQVVYSPNYKAFVTLVADTDKQLPLQSEEYADLIELRALAELIGPYGMKFLSEGLMRQISCQVDELKKLVHQNKETLVALRSNFDKPEQMKELQKKLLNVDNVLQRMTIVGVLLSFRSLAQEALVDVLDMRIPFLLSSIRDFQQHVPNGQDSMIVNEMASAAGLPCDIDPALCAALRSQKSEAGDDDYTFSCLLMVFVAVALPRLARGDNTSYKAALEAHANNVHCLAKAVNALAGALFTVHGPGDVELRLKEFLALASSSLLRLGQETEKEAVKNRESVYLLLDEIVQESPFLTMDLLESCFPYALLRTSYHHVYRQPDSI